MNLGGGKLSVLVGGWGREREAEGFLAWEWNSVIHLLFVWICLYSGPGSPPCSTPVLLINPLFNEASTDANLWLAGFWENVPQLSFLNVLAALEIFLCAPVPATCSVTRSDVWPCAPRVVWRRTRLNLFCICGTMRQGVLRWHTRSTLLQTKAPQVQCYVAFVAHYVVYFVEILSNIQKQTKKLLYNLLEPQHGPVENQTDMSQHQTTRSGSQTELLKQGPFIGGIGQSASSTCMWGLWPRTRRRHPNSR